MWPASPAPPPLLPATSVQIPITFSPKLEVTGHSSRGVSPPLHQRPCSLTLSCQPDYMSGGRKRRDAMEMSGWRQSAKHVVCPAAAACLLVHVAARCPSGCHHTTSRRVSIALLPSLLHPSAHPSVRPSSPGCISLISLLTSQTSILPNLK